MYNHLRSEIRFKLELIREKADAKKFPALSLYINEAVLCNVDVHTVWAFNSVKQ
jgi:hypothetical protein